MLSISYKVGLPLRGSARSPLSASGVSNTALRAYTKKNIVAAPTSTSSPSSAPLSRVWQSRLALTNITQSLKSYTQARLHSSSAASSGDDADLATVNWVLKTGEIRSITEKVGMNLLEIAHKHGIELEGACEASLACSTCHVIVEDPDVFEMTGEISDEENDMLDLAFGLTQTSRLGCQVKLTKELDGLTVRLPSATRNMMVDGHVPKPH